MIVYQNSLITIAYMADTDILSVDLASFEPYAALEIKEAIQIVVETLSNYKNKYLLLDASKISTTMPDADYREVINHFVSVIGQTNLQKVARIITSDPLREEVVYTMRENLFLPFQLHDFVSKDEAMHWLTFERN
ncbi:hypothetical protein ACFPIB_07060 [Adhaeribacter terreus]|uniref:STAS/SEC14 domain-containing protein n=2 Tax=Adhaeribacter terreus TaxID=529703 RepID=A0ABW0EBD7_9BACT